MTAVNVLFYFFVLMAAAGALAILFSKNVFKSAIYLLVTLLSVAALYVLLYAEFLAVAQILVYAGGITVIIIFGIMLTTRISGKPLIVKNAHMLSGGLVALSVLWILAGYLTALPIDKNTMGPSHINSIGLQIFSVYSLPFELAGLLLLIALIGAAVVTSGLKSNS